MVTEQQVKQWYNQWHSDRGKDAWRTAAAYPVFLDCLDVKSGKRLLDVGCGTGHLLRESDVRGLETWGVDISDEGARIAKQVSPSSRISTGKGESLQFTDGAFDYVTCIGALEHFLDMERSLQEIRRVCKEDGSICIVVPNVNFLPWKFRRAKGTKQQNINENLLSLDQWQSLFDRQRLEVSRVRQDWWFSNREWILGSAHPLQLLKRSLVALGLVCLPLRYTYQFIFVLKKR